MAKLNNVIKNDVLKRTEYNKLVTKVNGTDTTNFVSRTKYEKDGSDFPKIDKKVPDISDLVRKTDFNAKITEVEGIIPSITGLGTNSALTTIENKILDVSSSVKKKITIQKLVKLKIKLIITIMANILLLQNLILWQQMFLMYD